MGFPPQNKNPFSALRFKKSKPRKKLPLEKMLPLKKKMVGTRGVYFSFFWFCGIKKTGPTKKNAPFFGKTANFPSKSN